MCAIIGSITRTDCGKGGARMVDMLKHFVQESSVAEGSVAAGGVTGGGLAGGGSTSVVKAICWSADGEGGNR